MAPVEDLVSACQEVIAEDRPTAAVKDLLERAVRDPGLIDDLPGKGTGIFALHRDPSLSIFQVVVPQGYTSLPHDHRMWAVIGICSGREDNEFFRRTGVTLESSGGRSISDGDVLALGSETIHAIGNPHDRSHTVAIHVYGGDLVAADRSMWVPDPWTEEPYDAVRVTGTTFK